MEEGGQHETLKVETTQTPEVIPEKTRVLRQRKEKTKPKAELTDETQMYEEQIDQGDDEGESDAKKPAKTKKKAAAKQEKQIRKRKPTMSSKPKKEVPEKPAEEELDPDLREEVVFSDQAQVPSG